MAELELSLVRERSRVELPPPQQKQQKQEHMFELQNPSQPQHVAPLPIVPQTESTLEALARAEQQKREEPSEQQQPQHQQRRPTPSSRAVLQHRQ